MKKVLVVLAIVFFASCKEQKPANNIDKDYILSIVNTSYMDGYSAGQQGLNHLKAWEAVKSEYVLLIQGAE